MIYFCSSIKALKLKNSNYFFQSFLILGLAAAIFFSLKSYLPERLFPETKTESKNIIVDSLMLEAISEDETQSSQTEVNPDSLIVQNPENYTGSQYLTHFFEALSRLKNDPLQKVRIAYYGDSMTDGDLITQDLRQHLQDDFGGSGVGFVPITSESAKARASINHQFSENWKKNSFVSDYKSKRAFGPSGSVFFVNDSIDQAWLKFQSSSYKRHLDQLNTVTLFYGKSNNLSASVNQQKLEPTDLINSIQLKTNGKRADLKFNHIRNIPFYGLSFDSGKGVILDNFSSRGNSGLPFSLFNTELMNAFDKELNYDLIILHFGANVLSSGKKDYGWYRNSMVKVVNHLKACFPNADILIISTADKATKIDGKMQTDPSVNHLLEAQRSYSIETQTGFLNLYELMGGEDSMVKWADGDPRLANKDYTHFNAKGAEIIAEKIYQQIMTEYEKYRTKNQ